MGRRFREVRRIDQSARETLRKGDEELEPASVRQIAPDVFALGTAARMRSPLPVTEDDAAAPANEANAGPASAEDPTDASDATPGGDSGSESVIAFTGDPDATGQDDGSGDAFLFSDGPDGGGQDAGHVDIIPGKNSDIFTVSFGSGDDGATAADDSDDVFSFTGDSDAAGEDDGTGQDAGYVDIAPGEAGDTLTVSFGSGDEGATGEPFIFSGDDDGGTLTFGDDDITPVSGQVAVVNDDSRDADVDEA